MKRWNPAVILLASIVVAIIAFSLGLLVGENMAPHATTTQQYVSHNTSVSTSSTTAATTALTTLSTQTTTANATRPSGSSNATPAYTVKLAANASVHVGTYLTNATGYALYLHAQDIPYSNKSTCYGQCEVYWKPVYISNLILPQGISASKFGTITRTNGTEQTTYYGYPLYHYVGDQYPGQVNGQGYGAGSWLVVTYPNLTT
jgi:predicted lipoprotein with Yx(FWY)xxD motif